jgi:hypothetical protein
MNGLRRAGFVALCVTALMGSAAKAQVFDPFSNFIQIRGFYPFENGEFTSAPALDASLRLPLGTGSFGIKLEALTALRQRGQADVRLEGFFAGVNLRNEPNVNATGRDLSLAGLLLYQASEANVAALRDVSAAYSLETDTGATNGYELHGAELELGGDLAERWNWSVAYALTSDLNPVRNRVTHSADAWVRTSILEPVTLGVGAGLRARDGRVIYQGSLEGSLNITDRDTLGVRLTLTTAPGDEERLFYDTTRFSPLVLGVFIGRSNESALIWGASVAAVTPFGFQAQGQYEARFFGTTSHEFSLGVRYGGEAGSLGVRGSMNLEFDAARGLWFGRLTGQLTANLQFEPFTFSATARLDYGPDRVAGQLEGELMFYSFPWLVLLEADLKLRDTLVGAITAQGMYFVLPNVAVNLTALYRWQPVAVGSSGFSFGVGLRYAF